MTEGELDDYRRNVERMWELDSSRIFGNGSVAHAGIILESFIAHASRKVQIFCQTLAPEVFDADSFIEKLRIFLTSGKTLEIIVQEKPAIPTKLMELASSGQFRFPLSMEIRYCADSPSAIKTLRHNFAVADERAFRIEPDKLEAKAKACVNNPLVSKRLSSSFQRLWDLSVKG